MLLAATAICHRQCWMTRFQGLMALVGLSVMQVASVGCRPTECERGEQEAKELIGAQELEKASEMLRQVYNAHKCDSDQAIQALREEVAVKLRALRRKQEDARPAPTARPALLSCDAHSLWFDGPDQVPEGTPEERRTQAVAIISQWSEDCRRLAFEKECALRCDDFISGMIIDSAQTNNERASLTTTRLERNRASVAKGTSILGELRGLAAYAKRIHNSPRSSHYRNPNAGVEELAAAIASGNPCLVRMKGDFERLATFARKAEEAAPLLPIGFLTLSTEVAYLRSCLDCGDDRALCDELPEALKTADENLDAARKLVAFDERALKALKAVSPE